MPLLSWGIASLGDLTERRLGGDYLAFWAAGSILADGGSPYDPDRQKHIADAQGWAEQGRGRGEYEFMPYYYPPWVGLAFVPLVPLGYDGSLAVWLSVLIHALIVAAVLLIPMLPRLWAGWTLLVVLGSALWSITIRFGQLGSLLLLLLVGMIRLLDARRDFAAGLLASLALVKPQLTLLPIAGLAVASLRGGRAAFPVGCGLGLFILMAFTTLWLPAWPAGSWQPQWVSDMLAAPQVTPVPTVRVPSQGCTWWSLLRSVGLEGGLGQGLYFALAAPAVMAVLWRSWRQAPPLEIVSLGLVLAFAVAPYAQFYDVPLVLVAVLWLLGASTAPRWLSVPLAAVVVLGQVIHLVAIVPRDPTFLYWIWMPAVVGVALTIHAAVVCCRGREKASPAADHQPVG